MMCPAGQFRTVLKGHAKPCGARLWTRSGRFMAASHAYARVHVRIYTYENQLSKCVHLSKCQGNQCVTFGQFDGTRTDRPSFGQIDRLLGPSVPLPLAGHHRPGISVYEFKFIAKT